MKKNVFYFVPVLIFMAFTAHAAGPSQGIKRNTAGAGIGGAGPTGAAGPETSTRTLSLEIPGVLYASSAPFTNPEIPFPGAAWAAGSSTMIVTSVQLFVSRQSSTCVTSGYITLSSGTLNAGGVRFTNFMEVTTAALNTVNYTAKVSTTFVVNANWVIAANLDRVNNCGGFSSTDAKFELTYSTK